MRILLNSKISTVHIFLLLAVFTYSWEIEGWFRYKFPFGSFRLYQFLLFMPIAAYLAQKILEFKITLPRGTVGIAIWGFFMLAFIPNSLHLGNAINYGFYMAVNILAMLAIFAYFNTEDKFKILLKTYIYGNVFLAMTVIAQFILFHLGIDLSFQNPFLDIFPRCGGFTSEPSRFTNCTLSAFFIVSYLKETKSKYFSYCFTRNSFWIILFAFLISTSRIGLIIVLSWLVFRAFIKKEALLKKGMKIIALFVILTSIYVIYGEEIEMIFEGINLISDLNEGKASSSVARTSSALYALQVFQSSPIIGVSVGGVDPGIAYVNGHEYTPEINGRAGCPLGEGWECGGGSAMAQVIAASGIIAFPFFVHFLLNLLYRLFLQIKKIRNIDRRHFILLSSLMWGLVVSFLLLFIFDGLNSVHYWIYFGIVLVAIKIYGIPFYQKRRAKDYLSRFNQN